MKRLAWMIALAACGGAAGDDDAGADAAVAKPPPIEVPVQGSVSALQADANAVYAAVGNELRRYALDGGAPTILWRADPSDIISKVVRVGTQLFATTADTLQTVKVDGSGSTRLHTGQRLHRGLAASSNRVFVLDGTRVTSLTWSGSDLRTFTMENPVALLGAGNFVWAASQDPDGYELAILSATSHMRQKSFVTGDLVIPTAMASDGTHVFLAERNGPASLQVDINQYDALPSATPNGIINSTEIGEIENVGDLGMTGDAKHLVAAAGGAIFVFDRTAGTFVQLAPGPNAQTQLAVTDEYVFWYDASALRGTPL